MFLTLVPSQFFTSISSILWKLLGKNKTIMMFVLLLKEQLLVSIVSNHLFSKVVLRLKLN